MANYQSNLSQTTVRRLRGEPDAPRLENLDLSNGFISPFCLNLIAKSISFNNDQNNVSGIIRDVNLSRNRICGMNENGEGEYDPTGFMALIEVLTPSKCLRSLNLERNDIGIDGFRALGQLLESRNPLSQLILKRCQITTEKLQSLVKGMRKNNHLQILCLSGNFLNADSLVILGKSLTEKRCVLHYLDLSDNDMKEREAEALVGLMKENQSITTLVLDGNPLADRGMKHIGTMLSRSKCLESLSLHNTGICHPGTREIALALEQNKSLRHLGLQWNNISNHSVELLAKALLSNVVLKSVALIGNDVDEKRATLVVEASLIKSKSPISIDVPFSSLRNSRIVEKELEAIEYYPFQQA